MSGTYASPMPVNVGEGPSSLIESRFASAEAAAQSAASAAFGLLASIGNIEAYESSVFVPTFQMPSVPTVGSGGAKYTIVDRYVPVIGDPPTLEDVIINIGNPPHFDITPILPVIPEFPDLVFPELTEERPTVRDVTIPDMPTYTMPDPPVMNAISLPTPMSLDMPIFDAILPPDNITLPAVSIDPGILSYDSPILQGLKDRIYNWVLNGGTGLDATVEETIWMRDNERDVRAANDARQTASDEWSKRGFTLPNGVLAALFAMHDITFRDKRVDKSRDIMIKQAELAQANTHFYLEKGLALEVQLMDWTNKVGERTLAASKATQEAAISITQLDISRYNVKIEIYKAQAMVYETRIKAELNKVEIFKAQVEAAKLTADMNKIAADVYKTRIEAITALMQMYEYQLKAAMATLEVDKAKIDAFQSLVQAYVAQINGITSKFTAYNTRIEGEKTKVSIYISQVEAFRSRIEAFKVEADARIEEAKAIIEKNKLYIMEYGYEIEKEKVLAIASAERSKAVSEAQQAQAAADRAENEAINAAAMVQIKLAEVQIEASIRIAEGVQRTQEANMRSLQAAEQVRVEAARGGAAVMAQIASGAFSGVSVNAAMQHQTQLSNSYTGHETLSEAHNFDHAGEDEGDGQDGGL